LVKTIDDKKYCFIYKRMPFLKARICFPVMQKGESINVDRMWWCIDNKVDKIIIGYPDGKLYAFCPNKWKEYASKNKTYRKVKEKEYDTRNGKNIEREVSTATIEISESNRYDTKYKVNTLLNSCSPIKKITSLPL